MATGFLDGEDIPPDGEAAFHEAAGEQGHLRQAQTQRGEAGEVGEHRPGGAIGHQAASIEHQQALAELRDRIHAVRDQHDRQRAVAVEPPDVLQDVAAALGVQARRGLVQDEHPRLHRQHPGDGRPPHLPPAQLER